jgi:hypothetical protein
VVFIYFLIASHVLLVMHVFCWHHDFNHIIKKIRLKTYKLTLHCRNNDIIFLKKDKYNKQACYTFKFHSEIKIWLKSRSQQTTCITNKTCVSDKRIYQVFEWKNPGKNLANFVIIEYSSTFWTRSAALEVYMSRLEEFTYSIVKYCEENIIY